MKCKVCEKEFELLKKNKYIVNVELTALQRAFGMVSDKVYEAFDCPYCGCQNLVNERKENIIEGDSNVVEGFKLGSAIGSHDGIVGLDVELETKAEDSEDDYGDDVITKMLDEYEEKQKEKALHCECDYDDMTVEELRNLCKSRNIAFSTNQSKSSLINKLVKLDNAKTFLEGWGKGKNEL